MTTPASKREPDQSIVERLMPCPCAAILGRYGTHGSNCTEARAAGLSIASAVRADERLACVEECDERAAAYPESVFPPMGADDWKAVALALKRAGYPIDRISADNMRETAKSLASRLRAGE